MSDFLNPIAELGKPDSGKIFKAKEAYILKQNQQVKFYCPDYDCLDKERILFPKKSKLGNYFFSHRKECSHDIGAETLLHKLAIKWFENQKVFEIPKYKKGKKSTQNKMLELDASKTELEFRRLKTIVPDVKLVTKNNFEFAIEIVVTNDISKLKKKKIHSFNLPTIRIDLADFYNENKEKCRSDQIFIDENLDALLTNLSRKSWIVPPDLELDNSDLIIISDQKKEDSLKEWLVGLGLMGLLLIMINFFKKK